MKDIVKRNLLFLIGCMGTRFSIVYLAKTQLKYLPIMGYLGLIPAIVFALIFALKLRTTGAEVLGELIWWNNLRTLHSLFFFLFAYLAIKKNKNAWKVLLLDTLIGLIAFLIQRKFKLN